MSDVGQLSRQQGIDNRAGISPAVTLNVPDCRGVRFEDVVNALAVIRRLRYYQGALSV
jgi:hypothetical protein